MPNIGNIIISDAQATPVAHTFSPAKANDGYALWEDRASGILSAFNKLTATMSRPKGPVRPGQSRNIKIGFTLELPKLEAVSGVNASGFTPAAQVAYRPFVEVNFVLPERSNLQDRKDLRKLVEGLLGSQALKDAVENLDFPF